MFDVVSEVAPRDCTVINSKLNLESSGWNCKLKSYHTYMVEEVMGLSQGRQGEGVL